MQHRSFEVREVKLSDDPGEGPSKDRVRQWLVGRYLRREPLPCASTIRIQLGWNAPTSDMPPVAASGQDNQGK
jgi:hypothetical protein